MFADRLRVGRFTVENVECGVMLEEYKDAKAAMLGQSFLRHFRHTIDQGRGRWELVSLDGPEHAAAAGSDAANIAEATGVGRGADQIRRLLEISGDDQRKTKTAQLSINGTPVTFHAARRHEVEGLRQLFGEPDHVAKVTPKEGTEWAALDLGQGAGARRFRRYDALLRGPGSAVNAATEEGIEDEG